MADRYKVITFQLPLSGSQSRQSAMRQAPLLLSTPSLGITHLFVASTRVGKTTFNSLSRDHGAVVVVVVVGAVEVFQLPLSGSPPHEGRAGKNIVPNFQLPLSGSQYVPILYDPARKKKLSTPSLGITEPDSGIFRLSAAFCRGTLSHK